MEEPKSSETIDSSVLVRLAAPFADLMNSMTAYDGENIQDIVSAGLYALGCALAQTGACINVQKTIEIELAPLSVGYSESLARLRQRMI